MKTNNKTVKEPIDATTSIIKKIQKLLTLANNKGASKGEAENAMQMAQRLMTKYKISMASIGTTESENIGIKHEFYFKRNSKSINPADDFIMMILSRFYRVRVLHAMFGASREIVLVGTPEDIEIAKYVHAYLRNIFFKCWNEYKKSNPKANKRSYYFGLFNGLSSKMQTAQDEEKAKATKKATKQYDIVLVNTETAIKNYVNEIFGKTSNSRRSNAKVDVNSYDAGKVKGSTISINKAISA